MVVRNRAGAVHGGFSGDRLTIIKGPGTVRAGRGRLRPIL
jgi:hypothetical protein